jgi:DHA1 family tetracycline resistance protein-like MFS transporter
MQSRHALTFILLTVTIDAIGIGIIFPVMPELLQDVTGANISSASLWGGVLATSFAFMQFLCGPVVGNLSDRYGRRPIMLIALGVMAFDYFIMAIAGSVWILLIGRIVAGIAAATYATATAYVADLSAPEDRAKNFGYIGAAFGVGFILGPLLGGFAAEYGPRAPFWLAAVISAANMIYGLYVLPESLPAENRRTFDLGRANPFASFRAIGHLPGLKRYLAIMFFYTLAFQSYGSIWSFYGTERFGWDAWWNGLSLAAFGVCMAVVQSLGVAPAIRLWGEKRTSGYGMLVDAVAFGFYGFITSSFWALAFTPVAAAAGVAGPALQGLMTNGTPDDQQGELQGVITSVSSVAMGIAPMLMTTIFWFFTKPGAPIYSPGAPFLLAAVLMVICVLVLVADTRAPKKA